MAEQYTFENNTTLVANASVDGNIVWTQQNPEGNPSVDYSDTENTAALTDTINEHYVTVDEGNATQYLSVLETTNDASICNLNIEGNEENAEAFISVPDNLMTTDNVNIDDQLVVFAVEGSDDLYGVQLGRDEEGNIQKYEFKLRANKDGQLEAISQTLQLLPAEGDDINIQEVDGISSEHFKNIETSEMNENSGEMYEQEDNSNEHILPDNLEEIDQQQHKMQEELYEEEEHAAEDIKVGILEDEKMQMASVKQEILHDSSSAGYDEAQEEQIEYEENEESEHYEAVREEINQSGNMQELVQEDSAYSEENYENTEMENEINIEFETVGNCHPVYINEASILDKEKNIEGLEQLQLNDLNDNNRQFIDDFIEHNDSENEDYHIVEGLHITGDVENGNTITFNDIPSIEKSLLNNRFSKGIRSFKKHNSKMLLYVVQHSEKENLNSLSLKNSVMYKSPKTNPRSILKSSHSVVVQDNDLLVHDELMGKRFARGKEAVQARIFHNFINKTTIPQAPVRKDRLPRKQKIRPVERMDEEIVVQEVMVSPKGFVEAEQNIVKNNDNIEVTGIVELSDSDDDYDPKKANRRKKKHRKSKPKVEKITISDSEEESEGSIIEIVISDGENDENTEKGEDEEEIKTPQSALKRRRGRPPKISKDDKDNNESEKEDDVANLESPSKKLRTEIEDDTNILIKTEIPCPKCSKSFPSQNSLRTHLQHHNLEMSLRNARGTLNKMELKSNEPKEYKYKCNTCGNTFKNNILLTRHNCIKTPKFICSVCKKTFANNSDLIQHKKIHMKQQLCKSTTTVTISPKKIKSPTIKGVYKCKICSKICSSLTNLKVHIKTHKEFTCSSCSSSFISRFMLETHIRENCVKRSPKNRASTSMNKSAAETPIAGNISTKSTAEVDEKIVTGLNLRCEKCSLQFRTHQALFQHKVIKHGLSTPDKNITKSKVQQSVSKSKRFHGGVPSSKQMNKTYALLKTKLEFTSSNA